MKRQWTHSPFKAWFAGLFTGLFMLVATLPTSAAMDKEPWMYDDIVEVDLVISKISIPMDEDVMIIDARPYKPKYIKGFIPGP